MITIIVLSAILISIIVYIGIGIGLIGRIRKISDMLPLLSDTTARVKSKLEFSSSTVATTISLATVIIAFFELSGGLGLWLLWPVVTTALGLFFIALFAKKIWRKLGDYNYRPSLHQYLGNEFSSRRVSVVASVFTVVGYLSAFAVELTVGSRFLAGMIEEIPQWITTIVIATVAFIYTAMGGFRSVVVTDRVQMIAIWLLLFSIIAYLSWHVSINQGLSSSIAALPENMRSFTWSDSLWGFVLGIFIMNLLTYISNMGLWQRIAGAQNADIVTQGLYGSVGKSMLSWGLFVIIAIGVYLVVSPVEGENILLTFLKEIANDPFGRLVIFLVTLGLYGAMLSTASTQLIAISQTVYEDILSSIRNIPISHRDSLKSELSLSRYILVGAALLAVILVETLRFLGFSIADLAFSIYGAALGMTPCIILSLLLHRKRLVALSGFANASIAFGFLGGWASAFYGKFTGDENLIFLAPVVSTTIAFVIIFLGLLFTRKSLRV